MCKQNVLVEVYSTLSHISRTFFSVSLESKTINNEFFIAYLSANIWSSKPIRWFLTCLLAFLQNTIPCKQKNCKIQIDIHRCSGTNGVSNSSKFSKRNAKLDASIILYEFATRYRFNNDFESFASCFFFEESSSWRHSKRRQRSVMLLAIRVEICQPLPDVFHSLFRALYATRMCYSCSFMFLPIFLSASVNLLR